MSDQRRGREKTTSETDPEERWPDPETELPTVPEPPSPPSAPDASTTVAAAFWKSVLVVNFAIFSVCFGPMLVYFRGRTLVGTGIFAVGLIGFGYAYFIYRAFRRRNQGDNATQEPKE